MIINKHNIINILNKTIAKYLVTLADEMINIIIIKLSSSPLGNNKRAHLQNTKFFFPRIDGKRFTANSISTGFPFPSSHIQKFDD